MKDKKIDVKGEYIVGMQGFRREKSKVNDQILRVLLVE